MRWQSGADTVPPTGRPIPMTGQSKPDPNENLDPEIVAAMNAAEEAVSDLRGEGDSDPSDAPAADAGASSARVEELERELAALKDRWLRAVADHENYKKRVKRETEEAVNRALQKVLSDVLPVADNLDRALEVSDPEDQVAAGIRMVQNVFEGALAKQGIEPINALGKVFDPSVHDALQQFDSPEHPPGVVIQVFERGYTREGKLFRPARVIVAGPGSTGKAPEADEAGDAEASNDAAEEGNA